MTLQPPKREREDSVGMTSPIFRRSPLRRCGGSGPAKVGRFHRHRPGGAAATLVRGGFGGVGYKDGAKWQCL